MLRGLRVRRRDAPSTTRAKSLDDQGMKEVPKDVYGATREDWMLAPPSKGLLEPSSSSLKEERNEKAINSRELNPNINPNAAQVSSSESLASSSWKARALKRAQERAQEAGVSVDSVLQEHWGEASSTIANSYDRATSQRMERNASRSKTVSLEGGNMRKPQQFESSYPESNTKIYDKYKQDLGSSNLSRFGSERNFMRYATMPQTELNTIAQRALDAESKGDTRLYKELSDILTEIRDCKRRYKKEGGDVFDSSGRRIDGGDYGRKYMGNQSDQSLSSMYLEAKEHSVQSFDRNLATNIMKDVQYKSSTRNAHEYEDQYSDHFSGGSEAFETGDDKRMKKKQKSLEEKQKLFLKSQQAKEFKKHNHADSCLFCFENKRFKEHLVIAYGSKAYLAVSPFGCLVDGHCCIVPIQHVVSIREADEDVYEEILKFKQSLKKMFMSQGKDVIFIETVTPYSLKNEKHAFIECIPVTQSQMDVAPSYFKNSILEQGSKAYNLSASDWSENKKLIDTTGKGIHRCIPKGFAYFHVEFQVNGGYCHPIDSDSFSFTFGKEVVCGIMKKTPNEAKLKPLKFEEERKQAFNLIESYSKYDWTKDKN